MGRRRRDEQRQLAKTLRTHGKTWVEIAEQLRERWPELNPRAAIRLAHGWTQHEAAIEWNDLFDPPTKTYKDISDMETRRPGFAVLGKLARLYQCAASDLVTDISDYRHLDDARTTMPRLPAAARQQDPPHPEENEDVDRRSMVKLLGGATASLVAAPGFLHQATGGADPFQRFEDRRRTLIHADNLLGAYHAIPATRIQLDAISAMRKQTGGADRQRLLGLQVEYADFAGWLYQDVGEYEQARYWLDRALEWSHGLPDDRATSFVLARKSQLAADMYQHSDAIDAAEAASHLADPDDVLAAVAATYAGHAYALSGDPVMSGRWYERAYGIEERAAPQGPWGLFLDAAYIGAYQASSLATLGNYRQAVTAYDKRRVGKLSSEFLRDHGVYMAHLAVAQGGMGDHDQASETGLRALAVGTETRSARIMSALDQLAHMLPADTPFGETVAELRHHNDLRTAT